MPGYTVKITAKLPVASNDPQAMADASQLLTSDLRKMLASVDLRCIKIDPDYKPNLKIDDVVL